MKNKIKRSIASNNTLKSIYLYIKHIVLVNPRIKPNKFIKLKMNLLGFTSDQYYLYNLKKNNIKKYISEWERIKTRNYLQHHNILFDDKLLFELLIKNTPMSTGILFHVENSNVYSNSGNKMLDDDLICLIKKERKIFLKERFGAGGSNAFKISYQDGKYFINNNTETQENMLIFIKKLNDYVCQPFLNQHEYSSKVFDGSINTIRIITIFDEEQSQIKIPIAMHRFGTEHTRPVDNASQGGIFCKIDIPTGQLSSAKDYYNNSFITHPNTNIEFSKIIIPEWQDLINEIKILAKKIYFHPFLAWDVIITKKGFKIVEINSSTDYTFIQMFGGIKEGDIGVFYQENNII